MVLWDFFLFLKLKIHLKGKRFEGVGTLKKIQWHSLAPYQKRYFRGALTNRKLNEINVEWQRDSLVEN